MNTRTRTATNTNTSNEQAHGLRTPDWGAADRPLEIHGARPQTAGVPDSKLLILFDGVCNFCNETVLFLIDRDPNEQFVFASLQSELGQQTVQKFGVGVDLDTVVAIDQGRAYTRSDAALRIIRHMCFPWSLLYVGLILPRFLRNWGYNQFAKRRYKWFGKSDQCRIPTPELRKRFVG